MPLTLLLAATASLASPAPDFAAARDEAVHIVQELIRIDTSNPPGNETKAATWIRDRLAQEGVAAQIFESAPGRGSVVARLKGSGRKRPLLLMGHLDVVGVERDKWTVDPFAGLLREGYVYGRGASDDKGMVAANLALFLMLQRSHRPLDRDVILLAEAGEEGTTQFGIDFLVEKHWDAIDCEFALNEGGEALLAGGRLTFLGVSTTEKVPRGLRLVAHGSSGHGSMPRTDNAITHLAAAVAKVGAWQPPMRLNETTRNFFARLAVLRPGEAELYTHLDDPKVQERLRREQIQYNSMVRTSVVPTILRGGFRSNVIPADAEATLDVRALPDEDMDALVATLKTLIDDPAVSVEAIDREHLRPLAPPSSLQSEMFRALEQAGQRVFGAPTLPILQTGATDSAELRAKGVQAYGLSIPKTDDDLRRIHGNDERVSVEALGQLIQLLDAAVGDVAGQH
jgi:acetylornithine deacetylase/succinyl-diaminopimelate desuccinylase-like protein